MHYCHQTRSSTSSLTTPTPPTRQAMRRVSKSQTPPQEIRLAQCCCCYSYIWCCCCLTVSFVDYIDYRRSAHSTLETVVGTAAQYYNVTAVPKTLDIMKKLFADQPITYGEFGSKTPAGLWEMYEAPLPVVVAPPTPPAPPAPPSGPGCKLPQDCIAGVASTIGWYGQHALYSNLYDDGARITCQSANLFILRFCF